MRGADLLASTMVDAGVRTVFSLSGNQIMPLFDAMIDPGLRLVHTRHEAAAVFMAEAYARTTREVGVALVTAGPGLGNALGALYAARMSETPVLLLSGDSPLTQDGSGAFQELPQVEAARPFVKSSRRVTAAQELPEAFAEAVRTARSGRPGPVHLALPADVLTGDGGPRSAFGAEAFEPRPLKPDPRALDEALVLLSRSERPLILLGPSLSATCAPGLGAALEEAVAAPVVAMESPRGLRDPALGALTETLAEVDLVFLLGKRADFTIGFGCPFEGASAIVVDPERAALARARTAFGERLALAAEADAAAFARALATRADAPPRRASWRARVDEAVAARTPAKAGSKVTPDVVARAVDRALARAEDSVLVCDGGEFGQWAQAFASCPTRIINGPSGAIGGALPYAIAAKIARPDATVIALTGDGAAGFHFAEFETAAREQAAVIAVVGDDARWNAERVIQLRDYGPERAVGCELSPDARYDRAAAAFGCYGRRVEDPADLDAALGEAVDAGRPACLSVAIEGQAAPSASLRVQEDAR